MIRLAKFDDIAAITEITNHYIRESTSTFFTEELTFEDRRKWLEARSARHPVFVWDESGLVLGWAALSQYKARQAYDETAETSVYVRPGYHGNGYGRRLMQHVIWQARELGFHALVAGACAEQQASLNLHFSLGFQKVAHFRQVGRKFGRWLDVIYTELLLTDSEPLSPAPAVNKPHE